MKVNINAGKIDNVTTVEGNATFNQQKVVSKPDAPAAVPPTPDELPIADPIDERKGVFVSYAHADADWLARFRTMLAPLIRSAAVPIWYDGDIAPGDSWREKIHQAMASSSVAVLLVSPNFLASSFIMDIELPVLVEAAKKGELKLTWVVLRDCVTRGTPLREFQALYDTGHPLNTLTEPELDRALVEICEKLQRMMPQRPAEEKRAT